MKNKLFAALSALNILIFPFLLLPAPALSRESGETERKIIVFKNGNLNDDEKDELINRHGGIKLKDLKLIKGKVALIDKKGEEELKQNDDILRVDNDITVEALDKGSKTTFQPAQVLPWGINKINANLAWASTTADLVKVAVIDTGIDFSHPDLKLNLKGGINTINQAQSPNDDNGHGTHVAGIIGALNNSIGVVGVGPKIDLYAVKALNRNGSGFLSDIIEGIDWSIQNNIKVINMSLGSASDVQSFHDAVIRAYNAGITVVAAAGNDFGGSVNFPAAYPEAIAVSAIDQNNQIASFSSVGPEVDFAAPGVSIFSTYKGQAYRTLSGTSMASPHVAGTAALVISEPQKCDTDFDGVCSPSEVKARLAATATDLGAPGIDNLYGAGLIDAKKAVMQ